MSEVQGAIRKAQDKYFNHVRNCLICSKGDRDCSRGELLYSAWGNAMDQPPPNVASSSPDCEADREPEPVQGSMDLDVWWGADGAPVEVLWNGRRFRLIEEL